MEDEGDLDLNMEDEGEPELNMEDEGYIELNLEDEGYLDYHLGSDPPHKKKNNERLWSVVTASFVAALGSFSFGYGMGYSSAAVTQLSDKNTTDLYLDEDGITWFGVRKCSLFHTCLTDYFITVRLLLLYFARETKIACCGCRDTTDQKAG